MCQTIRSLKSVVPNLSGGLSQWLRGEKKSAYNAGDAGNVGLIPGLGRSPAGGHCNTLPYSWRENPKDRGAWQAMVHGV